MIKEFPKSRICAIDCYESVEQALYNASKFFKHHNIATNTKDGRNVILSFCFKAVEQEFKNTKSLYPKVIFCSKSSKTKKIESFIFTYLEKIMNCMPFPYCGRYEATSPDLEFAAINCLKKQKTKRKFNQFTTKIGYRGL